MTVEAILMALSTQYLQVFVDGAMVKSSELFSEEQSLVELKVWHRRLVPPHPHIKWFPATLVLDSAYLLQPHIMVQSLVLA